MSFIWHNGEFKPGDAPVFSAHDRLRLGEGVFNTMLAIDGHIHHAGAHMEKMLHNSALLFGEWNAPEPGFLIEAAQNLLRKNNYTDGHYALNTTISGGPGGRGLHAAENYAPQIVMRALPCPAKFPPVSAIIAETVRRNEGSPLSQIKCSNYGDHILALREAEAKGASEAILLNNAGNVACATAATVVAFLEGVPVTPPLRDGAMNGVTRTILLQRHNVTERSISPEDLLRADGIYITNSLRGAVPVVSLNGRSLQPCPLPINKNFHLE